MHLILKTLLNHVEPLQGFVYEASQVIHPVGRHRLGSVTKTPMIEIELRERQGSRGKCSRCQRPAPRV